MADRYGTSREASRALHRGTGCHICRQRKVVSVQLVVFGICLTLDSVVMVFGPPAPAASSPMPSVHTTRYVNYILQANPSFNRCNYIGDQEEQDHSATR